MKKKVIVIHSDNFVLLGLKAFFQEIGLECFDTKDLEEVYFGCPPPIDDPDVTAFISSYDWKSEGTNGVEVIRRAQSQRPDLTFILLSLAHVRGKEEEVGANFIERKIGDECGSGSPVRAEIARLLR